jgi:hypothetical protein
MHSYKIRQWITNENVQIYMLIVNGIAVKKALLPILKGVLAAKVFHRQFQSEFQPGHIH